MAWWFWRQDLKSPTAYSETPHIKCLKLWIFSRFLISYHSSTFCKTYFFSSSAGGIITCWPFTRKQRAKKGNFWRNFPSKNSEKKWLNDRRGKLHLAYILAKCKPLAKVSQKLIWNSWKSRCYAQLNEKTCHSIDKKQWTPRTLKFSRTFTWIFRR